MGAFVDAVPADWLAPGETAAVDVEGRVVAIANVDGNFYAFANECPHQGTVLGGRSLMRGRLIRCPEHGSAFDVVSGQCVLKSQDGWSGPLQTYATRVEGEVVQVRID